jgi:GNAT superfamily N-acetyltransferase
MGVLAGNRERSLQPIRAFDLARDLPALAALVEVSFESELSRTSSQIVAEMREMANWGLTLHVLSALGPPYRGLVWEEDGRVVGNVTMMRDRAGIWSLSNIAVLPAERGRGIGGALVDAAIERLRALDARLVTLQVRPENATAVGLYERRGFVAYDRVCELVLQPDIGADAVQELPSSRLVRRLRREDSPQIVALLSAAMPESARQIDLIRSDDWEQGTWRAWRRELSLGLKGQERIRLVAAVDSTLVGVAWATIRMLGTYHDVGLVATPGAQREIERLLLRSLLAELANAPRRPAHATVSRSQPGALEALEDTGFEALRDLDRMVLSLG